MPGPLAALLVSLAVGSPLGEVRREVLDNGLVVLLAPDAAAPLVSVAVMYGVGARNEAAGTTGLAHYAEHMNFRATRRFPGTEVTEAITRIGGRWNGYTWLDQTYYAATAHRDALGLLLDIEADRMTEALYDPHEFLKERTSVIAELHSYDDPHSVLYDAVLAAAFEIHPYRHNTIGWLTDVEAVTRDEAFAFYRRFYHPNNAVLVLTGDIDPEAALSEVRRRFGRLPAAGQPTAVRTVEPEQWGERRVTVRRPGPHARVLAAFRAPALEAPDFAAMVLFDALLAGGKGFRFTREYPTRQGSPLQRELAAAGLAGEARSDWQASRYPYVFTVTASVPGETDLERAERALWQALAATAEREWTEPELAAARRQVLTGWAADLDDLAGRAHQLAFFEVSGGYRYLVEMPERLGRVTLEDVRRFARARLHREQATVGWFVPTAPDEPRPAAPAAAAASAPAESAWAPPAPERHGSAAPSRSGSPAVTITLPNGLRAVLVPTASSALVAVRGRIDAGSRRDPAGAPGLSALATEWLARPAPGEPDGAPSLDWNLLQDPEDFANARWIEFTSHCLPEDLPALLAAVRARLTRARDAGATGAGDWAQIRAAAAGRAREIGKAADGALWREALAALYPAGSPLARPAWGEPDAIERVTPHELASFLLANVTPANTTVVLAGNLPSDARPLLERALGGDGTGRVGRRRTASPEAAEGAARPSGPQRWTQRLLLRPEKAQNDLRVVWPGDRSQAHDRRATEALLYLLGETGYAGRLGHALVDPGLVYSVYATLQEQPGLPGFLMVRTAASPDDTPAVLQRVRAIVEGAAAGGFTAAELAEAKTYLRGKAARARAGALATAATVLQEGPEARPDPAGELTLEQLNDTARRLFRNGRPLALVAGPRLTSPGN